LCNLHDKLFDRFLISFDDEGKLLTSKILLNSIQSYGLENGKKYLQIKDETKFFLAKHREIFEEQEKERTSDNI
jgi:hypothetical protein